MKPTTTDLAITCMGLLALEVSPDQQDGRLTLDRDAAEQLTADLAVDLRRLLPGIERLDGAFAGAHFDPAELLRPGFPVHAALAELVDRAPGRERGRVFGFGAHDGRMPTPLLQPDPQFAGGLLRLLPFVLVGEPDDVATIGRVMEERLLDTGMAGAGLALQAQSRFGLLLEHARFMSLHDLCALTAMQYEHAGLEPVWRLIEAALLAPGGDEWLRADGEPLALFSDGQVRIADPDVDHWHGEPRAASSDEHDWQQHRRRVRQLAAIVSVHGIAVERIPLHAGDDAEQALRRATTPQ